MRYGTGIRGARAAVVFAGLLLAVAGCHRKPVVPPLPQITQPVDLETPLPPENLPMVEAPPVKLPPVPTASAASKIKRERRKKAVQSTATSVVAPPAQSSETTPAPAEVATIGALSSGGDTSPRAQQEAAGLISANEKRINGLSTHKVEEEKAQISKVRNFQRQAQEALNTGDTEGAKTLATKAKLLLDDIEKL
jgi:ribosomal protein S20